MWRDDVPSPCHAIDQSLPAGNASPGSGDSWCRFSEHSPRGRCHRGPTEVADQFTQSSAPYASWQDVGGGRAG